MFCLSKFCCVCLKKTTLEMKKVNSLDSDNISFRHKLNYCVYKHDYLREDIPLNICCKCYSELKIAYEFRKTCLRSNAFIKGYILQLKHAFNSDDCNYSEISINLFEEVEEYEDIIVLEDSFSEEENNLEPGNNNEYIQLKSEILNQNQQDVKNDLIIIDDSSCSSIILNALKSEILCQNTINDGTNCSDDIPLVNLIKKEEIQDDVETVILQSKNKLLDVGNNLLSTLELSNSENNNNSTVFSDISSNCSFFNNDDKLTKQNKKTKIVSFKNCLQISEQETNSTNSNLPNRKLRCYICNVDFTQKILLNWHLNIHKDFTNSFLEDLDKNIDEDKFKCQICKADFSKEILLKWHMKIHESVLSEKIFKCHLCPEKFELKIKLTYHLKNKHNSDKFSRICCEICGKRFSSKKCLSEHRSRHNKDKNKWFKCNFCTAAFLERGNLFKHRKKHIENAKFVCNICERKFPYKSSLNRHLSCHNIIREKNYHCTVCSKSFEHKNILYNHMKYHVNEGKHFSCTYCHKMFVEKQELDDHIKKHLNIFQYKCNICNKVLSCQQTLNKHRTLHEKSEQKFSCHLCEKTFNYRRYLNKHLKLHAFPHFRRQHNQIKPFSCKICSKKFFRKDFMNVHIKRYHPCDE